MAILYTGMQLVSLSPGLQSFLDANLWRSLVKFGISRARPTQRACRAGLRKQLRPSISQNLIHTSEAFLDTSNAGSVLFSSIYTDIAQNRDNLHNRTETTLNILSITPLVASARITTFLYLQMTVTLTKKILLISRFQN